MPKQVLSNCNTFVYRAYRDMNAQVAPCVCKLIIPNNIKTWMRLVTGVCECQEAHGVFTVTLEYLHDGQK